MGAALHMISRKIVFCDRDWARVIRCSVQNLQCRLDTVRKRYFQITTEKKSLPPPSIGAFC